MTIVSIFLCDYCACEIDPDGDWVKLTLSSEKASSTVADYHRRCWHTMVRAIKFAQDAGAGLEQLQVATEQAIAELRRRHRPSGSGSA